MNSPVSSDGLYYLTYSAEEPNFTDQKKHIPNASIGSFKKRGVHSKEIVQSGCDHYHVTHTHPSLDHGDIEAKIETAWALRGRIACIERDLLTFKHLLEKETSLTGRAVLIQEIAQDKADLAYYTSALNAVQMIIIKENSEDLTINGTLT